MIDKKERIEAINEEIEKSILYLDFISSIESHHLTLKELDELQLFLKTHIKIKLRNKHDELWLKLKK